MMNNMHTEEEAKEMKCPFKVHNGECVASECMAWKFETKHKYTGIKIGTGEKETFYPGFCGLVGIKDG